jgi:hypothetical protein
MLKSGFGQLAAPRRVIAGAALAIRCAPIADRALERADFVDNAPNFPDARKL